MSENEAVDFTEGDSLVIDLNAVEESAGFEAIPRGMYPVIVHDLEFAISQNSGNPMWSMQLEVEEGDYQGRILFTHMVFAGKGLGITKRHLSRIAPELLEEAFDPQDEDVIGGMLGKRAKAKVTIRKYQGEDRNNVGDLFEADDDGGFS